MVAGATTTYAISATITPNIVRVRIPLMQGLFDTTFIFYVIKFVCDLRQIRGFLWVVQFHPPIKLTATIYLKYSRTWR